MKNRKAEAMAVVLVCLGLVLVGCGSTTTQHQKGIVCPPGKVVDVYSKSPTYRQCVDRVGK